MRNQQNQNGLTFIAWCRAAGIADTPLTPDQMLVVVQAWQRDEDPAEHLAGGALERERRHDLFMQLEVIADELDTTTEHRLGAEVRAVARKLQKTEVQP